MSTALGKVFLLLIVTLGVYLWTGYTITELTGGEKSRSNKVELTPESGESIFWGKGRCYTCHSLGGQGSAVRCPNLGQFGEKFELAIGARAVERAKQRSEETGQQYTATDYLVESLAKPDAYIVDGYKDEMAIVYAPPISLSLLEIQAVLVYLQSQDGEYDVVSIETPSDISQSYFNRIIAATEAGGGDPGNGQIVFEDYCMECHMIGDEGGEIGPNLSHVGSMGQKFISESITSPASKITEGFETWEIIRNDGRRIIGIKSREDSVSVEIMKDTGDLIVFAKSDIKQMTQDDTKSLMPEDLTEALTVKDFQDVQAYLLMQKMEE